jgi:hypothetical protein
MLTRTTLSTAFALGIAAIALATPQTAQAGKDMKMRFGIGGQRTLTGYSQIRARFFPIKHLHVGLGFGIVMWDPHQHDVDNDAILLATLSPEVMGWYVTKSEGPISANFGGGLRFGIAFGADGVDDDNQNGLDNPFELDIELPMSAEIFFGNHFSFAPEAGIVFRIVPGESAGPGDDPDDYDENPGSGCTNTTNPVFCALFRGGGAGEPGFGFDIGANAGLFAGGSFNFFF